MIIIKCNHDIDQKIEIYIDNIKFPVIKNNIVSTLNFDNTKSVHNIIMITLKQNIKLKKEEIARK